jgi:hypothetical protein
MSELDKTTPVPTEIKCDSYDLNIVDRASHGEVIQASATNSERCEKRNAKHGGITDTKELRANLRMHCLPEALLEGSIPPLRRLSRGATPTDGTKAQAMFAVR